MIAPRRSRVNALGVAAIAALLTVVATYSASRVAQGLISPEPDPALVSGGGRIAMFWRLLIGAYVGAMAAVGVWTVGRRDLALAVRGVAVALPVVALALVLQGLLAP